MSFFVPSRPLSVNIYLYLCRVKPRNAIKKYLEFLSTEQRRSVNTIITYNSIFEDFARYLDENNVKTVSEITSHNVRNWQAMHAEAGDAPNTLLKRLSVLRSWFTYMRRHKMIKQDVMAKISNPKRPHPLPVFFREKEVEKIYNSDLFPDTFEGERDKLLLRVLYETGIRRSEAVGLTEAGIDLNNLTIKVLGKRNKERFIPIEEELANSIRIYLEHKHRIPQYDANLFVKENGVAINSTKVYAIVKHYMSILSNADRISPHVFRHSFATQMLNEGANINAIKELLGHASLKATEIYTHVTREHLKEVYKHAHPRVTKDKSPKYNP